MKKNMLVVTVGLAGLLIGSVSFGQTGDEAKKENPAQNKSSGLNRGQFGQGGMGGSMMRGGSPSVNPIMNGGLLPPFVLNKILGDPKEAAALGISEDKIKTLKDSMDQSQKQNEELRKQLMEAEQARRKLMENNSTDENALIAVAEKLSQARLEMEKASIKQMVLIRKTITQEQMNKLRDKAKEMMQEHMKQMRDNKGSEGKPAKPADQQSKLPDKKT